MARAVGDLRSHGYTSVTLWYSPRTVEPACSRNILGGSPTVIPGRRQLAASTWSSCATGYRCTNLAAPRPTSTPRPGGRRQARRNDRPARPVHLEAMEQVSMTLGSNRFPRAATRSRGSGVPNLLGYPHYWVPRRVAWFTVPPRSAAAENP